MADYNVVNAPQGNRFSAPLVDFGVFGDLANDYYKGRQNKRADDVATAFASGLPMKNGQPDYAAMAQILGSKGDIGDSVTLSKLASDQQLRDQALQGGLALTPQGGPQAPVQSPVPQPPAAATMPTVAPSASGGAAARPVPAGDQAGSVVDLVSSRLPSDEPRTGTVINSIARSLKVDPNTALTADQKTQVDRLVTQYEARTRQSAPAASAAPAAATGTAGGTLTGQVPLPKGFNDPQAAILALRGRAAQLAANPYAKGQAEYFSGWADRIETAMKPVHVGDRILSPNADTLYAAPNKPQSVGGNLVRVDASGQPEVIYRGTDGLLDKDTIRFMAEQYRAGDTSVFTNLGRGAQGAENIKALRQEIQRQNAAAGDSGADQAFRNAEFFGTKAGQRTLGARETNIELPANEFKKVLPVVAAASAKVDRTRFPDLNRIILAGESRTGDPDVVAFGGGVNSLINIYARAISPTGAPTISDKDHAREILSAAWSQGQFDAAVGMMQREINAALESPGAVREEQRRRFLNKGQPSAPGPKGGGTGGAAPVVRSKADYDKLAPGATFVDEAGATWQKPKAEAAR